MTTIQLAKPFTPSKLTKAVYVSQKLDGVPVLFTVEKSAVGMICTSSVSRQGEDMPSVYFLCRKLEIAMKHIEDNEKVQVGTVFKIVAEITHEHYTDFKDVSGVVRTQEPQTGLIANVFDFVDSRWEDCKFAFRVMAMRRLINENTWVRLIPQHLCQGVLHAEALAQSWLAANPNIEGLVFRCVDDLWAPGKRTWGYQKYVQDPTIDLALHSVEEAVSETGERLGMVGRLNFYYFKDTVIGVGPGKLTHSERKQLWEAYQSATLRRGAVIATIKYKRDPSYEALRQPTFQHWREDKHVPDA